MGFHCLNTYATEHPWSSGTASQKYQNDARHPCLVTQSHFLYILGMCLLHVPSRGISDKSFEMKDCDRYIPFCISDCVTILEAGWIYLILIRSHAATVT